MLKGVFEFSKCRYISVLTENEQIKINTDYLFCTFHLSIGVKARWPVIYITGEGENVLCRNRRCREERSGTGQIVKFLARHE